MRIEQSRPMVLQLTLSAYELATLMAAARWAAEGATGELSPDAVTRLRAVVASYVEACKDRSAGPEDGSKLESP
ncbi:MAG: hypothetical protein ACWGSD_20650 [Thermodesulfobacteriota bacterium]